MARFISGLVGLCSLSLSLVASGSDAGSCDAIDLDQGWTHKQSEQFWFTTQGSRLMPYSWFLSLEVSDPIRQTLFVDRTNMDRFGYISAMPSKLNPDGLPIGFVKDVGTSGDEHIGLTCAACHTGSLNIRGKPVIVEGGQSLADFWSFLSESVAALETAAIVPSKFERFSKRVLRSENPSAQDVAILREQMRVKLDDLQTRLRQNAPVSPYGFGRVDAFGDIFTRVLAQDLGIPENAAPPYAPEIKAPVSYPFLWDTPQHDLVQWNGAAPNSRILKLGPLARNIGEVFGVFGELKIVQGKNIPFFPFLNAPLQFISSAQISNLIQLENQVQGLRSPVWPRGCLPLADAATLTRGKNLYNTNCATCHRLLVNPERKDEHRVIEAVLKTLPEVSTDPTMAMNFARRTARTGLLRGTPDLIKLGKFGSEANGIDIILATINGVMLRGIVSRGNMLVDVAGLRVNLLDEMARFREALRATQTPRYKARPLNGIWATAPYLHNGSVPTLWDLLKPAGQRPKVFDIGSRSFDAEKVGLDTTKAPRTFRFDTSAQGNWNNGHEFGTALRDSEKKDLLEFLKTL
jgi:hypothetical protein